MFPVWEQIQAAFANDENLLNLMIDPGFADELNSRQMAWRRIVTLCIASGIACPALSASLNYFDTYRRSNLPANLTQAQRGKLVCNKLLLFVVPYLNN